MKFTKAERALFAKLGQRTSAKKAAASRRNGQQGGRPKKRIVCMKCGEDVEMGQRGAYAAFCPTCLAFRLFDELRTR